MAFVNQQQIVYHNKKRIEAVDLISGHFENISNMTRIDLVTNYFHSIQGVAASTFEDSVMQKDSTYNIYKIDLNKTIVYVDPTGANWKKDQSVYKIKAIASWKEKGITISTQPIYMFSHP